MYSRLVNYWRPLRDVGHVRDRGCLASTPTLHVLDFLQRGPPGDFLHKGRGVGELHPILGSLPPPPPSRDGTALQSSSPHTHSLSHFLNLQSNHPSSFQLADSPRAPPPPTPLSRVSVGGSGPIGSTSWENTTPPTPGGGVAAWVFSLGRRSLGGGT